MKAMLLKALGPMSPTAAPLVLDTVPQPVPSPTEVLIRVSVCGVCHTELDEIEGRTPPPTLPVIPGHQVVGVVERTGVRAGSVGVGDRVGVAWIGGACGECPRCIEGRENLCGQFRATGRDFAGGYAEYMTADASFVHPIPEAFTDAEAAPLLCAGAIGFRSLRLSGLQDGEPLGLSGFGASGHIVLKLVRHTHPSSDVLVFSRSEEERAFARELGAVWAGGFDERPPELMRSIIDTTPAWAPVVRALDVLEPGGRLVINAIRKEEPDRDALTKLDYGRHLWMEKQITSVANLTREDVREFLDLAATIRLRPEVREYPLEDANRALQELVARKIRGAKVLRVRDGGTR
jgi:propanol-preferring alcohol dehydrogenase